MCWLFALHNWFWVHRQDKRQKHRVGGAGGKKRDSLYYRLKRARCPRAGTIASAGMHARSATTELRKLCSLAQAFIERSGVIQPCEPFVELTHDQKCMHVYESMHALNAALVSSVCLCVKQTNTPWEPIMCPHAWLLHRQPKTFKMQRGTPRARVLCFHYCTCSNSISMCPP